MIDGFIYCTNIIFKCIIRLLIRSYDMLVEKKQQRIKERRHLLKRTCKFICWITKNTENIDNEMAKSTLNDQMTNNSMYIKR